MINAKPLKIEGGCGHDAGQDGSMTSSRFSPLMVIRLTSQTAYSSAVRRPSVAIRHRPFCDRPSKWRRPRSYCRRRSQEASLSPWVIDLGGGEPGEEDAKPGKNTSPAVIRRRSDGRSSSNAPSLSKIRENPDQSLFSRRTVIGPPMPLRRLKPALTDGSNPSLHHISYQVLNA